MWTKADKKFLFIALLTLIRMLAIIVTAMRWMKPSPQLDECERSAMSLMDLMEERYTEWAA